MKYAYYEYYVAQNGCFVGAGKLIEEDVSKLLDRRSKKSRLHRKEAVYRLAEGYLPQLEKNTFPPISQIRREASITKIFETIIRNFTNVLGPLGADDFIQQPNGTYLCSSFTLDIKWLDKQIEKIQTLHAALLYHQGYINGELHAHYKEDETSLENFLSALSDCMVNVRTIFRQGSKWDKELHVDYVPLNLFGVYTLSVLNAYKKGLTFANCIKCDRPFYMKSGSGGICETCLSARRQRKNNVRLDIQKGKSLDKIIKSRRTNSDELTELYNEIIQEITEA